MAITPRTRPPLLDQRLPPRRPELQQRIDVPAAAPPPPPPVGPPFPFWLVPVGTLLATCVFLTTHFLDHNSKGLESPSTTGDYHPSPWGPNPEGRLGPDYVNSLNERDGSVGYHSLPKYGDDEDADDEDGGVGLDIKSMYGEDITDGALLDARSTEYLNEHCILHGDVPKEVLSCEPISELAPNLDFPNVAVEYISDSYNSDEDSTTFTYNVCSLDDSVSISHVTFPYLGNCCAMRTHYFGSTSVGGIDSMTCTFGNSLDTGFASLPAENRQSCQIYTATYMGNVPATSSNDEADKLMVAIGLGTDKYLLQHVPGPDCRPPFKFHVPESYTGSLSSGAIGGEDGMSGTVDVPATEGRESNGFGEQGSDFDFENMFGTETKTVTTETTTTNNDGNEGEVESEGDEFDFNEMFGTETKTVTTETTTTTTDEGEEAEPEEYEGSLTATSTTTSTTESTGREAQEPQPQVSQGKNGVQNFSSGGAFPWEAPQPVVGGGGGGRPIPGTTVVGGGYGGGGGYHGGAVVVGGGGGGGGFAAGGRNYAGQFSYAPAGGAGGRGVGMYSGATHGYTSAVNVQSQEYAFTKTAMYSEATDDCVPRADIGYRSKSGQDEALFEIYYSNPFKCGGVVVEINVGNGHSFSSSYYFEYAMGWKSILIEPNPKVFQKLQVNRPSTDTHTWNAAFCSNEDKKLTFVEGNGSAPGKFYSTEDMNSVVASVPLAKGQAPNDGTTVRCIEDLSEEIIGKTDHRHIDIMYVSNRGHGTANAAENAEEASATHQGMGDVYAALSSINFETLSLSILVLEVDASTSFYYSSTKTLLESKGYVKAEWDIRRWCPPVFGSCAQNEVWLEKGFNPLPLFGDPENPITVSTTLNGNRRRLEEVYESKPRLSAEQLEQNDGVMTSSEGNTKKNLRRR